MDSDASFECDGYRINSMQAGLFDRGSVHWGDSYANIRGSVH